MGFRKISSKEILDYHAQGRPGKLEVVPSKPTTSQRDLSIAYSPGVAIPCQEIARDKESVYRYTTRANLVGVISNGTAVLGLGDIGPEASKPVMEGKALLFKIYADIDAFDLELNARTVDEFVAAVKALEPTFGGINLEDIKAPDCFEIEERLKKELRIPIMHDDQHGTAIIAGAALINALELAGKKAEDVLVVFSGAGASAISCARLFLSLGVRKENIVMVDSKGVIRADRLPSDPHKAFFATHRPVHTLREALNGADVFVGLSVGNILTADDLRTMAPNPIVFALANPDPEISYEEAIASRDDIIVATGRSDYPNQVNNVLGFPFIFRGALDVRATCINEEMKLAAVRALADLARQPVPEIVHQVYNEPHISFGRHYIIPKPVDPRLIYTVAPAVARAAMESGVARQPITDWEEYREQLKNRLGISNSFLRNLMEKARRAPKKIVFAEGNEYKIIKAAQIICEEGIAQPILLGSKEEIQKLMAEYAIELPQAIIMDVNEEKELRRKFTDILYKKRQRKGLTFKETERLLKLRTYFGLMMVETGLADGFISGLTRKYAETLVPALQVIGPRPDVRRVAGMYALPTKHEVYFLADTTTNINPDAEDIVDITLSAARTVSRFNIEPRIALLSYSNFGSSGGAVAEKMAKAAAILREKYPQLLIDGEMQANFAVNPAMLQDVFPFSPLAEKGANVLIFPDLDSGNIAYKLLQSFGLTDAIGPILMGMAKPVHILQIGCSVREIVNLTAVAVLDAQTQYEPIPVFQASVS
ncbi:MAG: NADP-dependent malic enzyme [Flavobacteriales bacterium]|nr:NADP-dependent malic enzyme [Flavobacteriales bacterium]MDW8410319.1 NADP-dependent malic enzyme [Flavobacteriales bacterium]